MLVLGDREDRKTEYMLDLLANVAHSDPNVIFVYCAIAKTAAEIAHIRGALKHSSAGRSLVVATRASDTVALHTIAPYAACSIAEFHRDSGSRVLVVYDDLTRHADALRHVALLLQHPPGREAYPGDVFFAHSRLLERAAQLSRSGDGVQRPHSPEFDLHLSEYHPAQVAGRDGSLTAFPIIETLNGDFTAYLPTNAISITDGQLVLSIEHALKRGSAFAIDTSASVSRISALH